MIKATLVSDIDECEIPGAFEYCSDIDRKYAGMLYICPCGCGSRGFLPFKPDPSPSWNWDGNIEVPTLQPSVHHQRKYSTGELKTHWHGFLEAGYWKSV